MADGNANTSNSSGTLPNVRNIPYANMRDWLEEADKLGEVKHVSGASWERDIGMATEVVQHSETAPCVVFEDIPGTTPGSRVLVNFFGGKRMNMTLGFPLNIRRSICLMRFESTIPRTCAKFRMKSLPTVRC